jgi:hypothetical protein
MLLNERLRESLRPLTWGDIVMPTRLVFERSFRSAGRSLTVTIPKVIVDSLKIEEGQKLFLWLEQDNTIVISLEEPKLTPARELEREE